MIGQSRFRRVCLLTVASLGIIATDFAVARSLSKKGERTSHHVGAKAVTTTPREARSRGRAAPHPLVIRPNVPREYLCPRLDDFSKRCVIVRTPSVELSGPGSSAAKLGSSELQPPQVPPVNYNEAPGPTALGPPPATIPPPNSLPSPSASLAAQQQTLAAPPKAP